MMPAMLEHSLRPSEAAAVALQCSKPLSADDVSDEDLREALRACRTALRVSVGAFSSLVQTRTQRLQQLRVFVLDNSLRESTVGQIRGHVLTDKRRIWQAVQRAGLRGTPHC